MKQPKYPSLYQVNTRVWLTELSRILGRKATLDDISDIALDHFKNMGFDWIWFLSVWTTGEKGRNVSRENPEWRLDFEATLPDLQEEDIAGSGFAIAEYKLHPDMGGDDALKRLRERLSKRGLKLMLDFVPNHMGPDHSWVEDHPEYFVSGTESDLQKFPQNYKKITRSQGDLILAYGRDPYFSGWPDTVQLDYSNPATVDAMTNELLRISGQCDGVRCDMAMLVLPEVFEKTWGRMAQTFWPIATQAVREKVPGFCFMAEVYWDMEWDLQQLGFDYTYDKKLYDLLHAEHAGAARTHLLAEPSYQDKLARFLENHDEPRAASNFQPEKHEAAALITYFATGLRFFHQGQFQGFRKRISPHLVRGPVEPINEGIQGFYYKLIDLLKSDIFKNGRWQLIQPVSAWNGNGSWDNFIAYAWESAEGKRKLVVVNYSAYASQCYLLLPFLDLSGKQWRLKDELGNFEYDRDGNDLSSRGLYMDIAGWHYHLFDIQPVKT
jgi:glycosidase